MVNPYDPQSPAKPDYFGGRKTILAKVVERVQKAVIRKQSGGVLIYGYRGVGKTSLLNKITSIYGDSNSELSNNFIIISKALGKSTTDTDLYQILIENITEKVKERKSLLARLVADKKVDSVKVLPQSHLS